MTRRKTEDEYRSLAEFRGFRLVGELPQSVMIKTMWECSEGHRWEANYSNIREGRGCPYCYGNAPKTEEDYHTLAMSKGFCWIGTFPKNVLTKTRWRCSKGHEWMICYNRLKVCPRCYKKARKIEDDYHSLAKKRGFEWLGQELPKRGDVSTRWKCAKGHEWSATYYNIRAGSGCPMCVDVINGVKASKPQIWLAEQLGGTVNYKTDNFCLDIAFPRKKHAVEYDCWYWHKDKLDCDKERVDALVELGWSILSIKTNDIMPDLEEIQSALAELDYESMVEIVTEDWGIDN